MLNQSKEVLCIFVSFRESRDSKKEPEINFYDMLCDIEEVFTAILRRTLRSETVFGNLKPFKNDEKYFLFHLKSLALRFQDI